MIQCHNILDNTIQKKQQTNHQQSEALLKIKGQCPTASSRGGSENRHRKRKPQAALQEAESAKSPRESPDNVLRTLVLR